jgi:CheY-like chemotaxis protein
MPHHNHLSLLTTSFPFCQTKILKFQTPIFLCEKPRPIALLGASAIGKANAVFSNTVFAAAASGNRKCADITWIATQALALTESAPAAKNHIHYKGLQKLPQDKVAPGPIEPWGGLGMLEILTVDDEIEALNVVQRHLIGLAKLTFVTDPFCVVKQIEQSHFDALIIAVRMPKLNGAQLLNAIRQVNTKVPVILASSYAFDAKIIAASSAIVMPNAFLTKPFDKSLLVSCLETVTGRRLSKTSAA